MWVSVVGMQVHVRPHHVYDYYVVTVCVELHVCAVQHIYHAAHDHAVHSD